MSLLSIVLLCLSLALPAHAREAEDERISEAMATLARKGQWAGVERRYLELSDPSAADHLLGAQAARNRGDLAEVLTRLDAAIADGDTDEAPTWRADLVARSRAVHVEGDSLVSVPAPFTPDGIAAMRLANQALSAAQEFRGRLYLGSYEIDGFSVELRAGDTVMRLRAPPTLDPPPLMAEAPPAPDLPRAPEPSPDRKPRVGRAILLGAAGGLVATSAGLYATGASRRARWASADDVRDVHLLRTETNRYTTLSGLTLGVAVGAGTLGVALP